MSEFKTITFKNGKTLEITQEQFLDFHRFISNYETEDNKIITFKKDGNPVFMINKSEIAFIS